MGFVQEFREFAVRGNMVDMAVGIVIGASFATVVSSLVDDIFMPVIGLALGGVDFTNLFVVLANPTGSPVASIAEAQETAGVVTLNLGLFLNAIVQFLIVAFALFLVVKGINTLRRKEAAKEDSPAEPPAPPREEVLLTEIRDLLKPRS